MSKIAMIGIAGNPSTQLSSHNAGWTLALSHLIKDVWGSTPIIEKDPNKFDEYDIIVINEGVNYKSPTFNFFGGVSDLTIKKLEALQKYAGRVICYNEDIDIQNLVNNRRELKHLGGPFPYPEMLTTTSINDSIIIGDSHALSIYRPGWDISRNDGKTLYGATKNNGAFVKEILNNEIVMGHEYKRVHLYFGNISTRFHWSRLGDRAMNTDIASYILLIDELIQADLEVHVQGLIPIEDESRKIPGTGKLNGQNFYGTMEERQATVTHFNEVMQEFCDKTEGVTFHTWNFEYPLSFDIMEARGSVHIRPAHYAHSMELLNL